MSSGNLRLLKVQHPPPPLQTALFDRAEWPYSPELKALSDAKLRQKWHLIDCFVRLYSKHTIEYAGTAPPY